MDSYYDVVIVSLCSWLDLVIKIDEMIGPSVSWSGGLGHLSDPIVVTVQNLTTMQSLHLN